MKECCEKKPVFTLTGGEKLCRNHFINYFEKKVRKTLRTEKLIGKKEKILVACSGGKDSSAILYLLSKIIKNPSVEIIAFHIDLSIGEYSKQNKKNLENLCRELGIEIYTTSFKEDFKKDLSQIQKKLKSKKIILKTCNVCGILKRYILNKKAKEMKATLVVTGHNLDDEAQSILMNIFKNQTALLARLGPKTGIKDNKNFIPRIKPLYYCTEEEVKLYIKLMKFKVVLESCPHSQDSYRHSVEMMLNPFEKKHSGTKYGIIKSFMELKPALMKMYKSGNVRACKKCGEPASKDICNTCKLIDNIK